MPRADKIARAEQARKAREIKPGKYLPSSDWPSKKPQKAPVNKVQANFVNSHPAPKTEYLDWKVLTSDIALNLT